MHANLYIFFIYVENEKNKKMKEGNILCESAKIKIKFSWSEWKKCQDAISSNRMQHLVRCLKKEFNRIKMRHVGKHPHSNSSTAHETMRENCH